MSEIIRWDKPQLNNFIAIPRIAKEELDPYEFKLYAHYIDETRWQRTLKQGARATGEAIEIGKNKICEARKTLQEKGYITVTPSEKADIPDDVALHADIWRRNSERYDSEETRIEDAIALILGSALTTEQLEAISRLVSSNKDAGVPDQGQPVPKDGHGCPESGTDSYIDESVEEIDAPAEQTLLSQANNRDAAKQSAIAAWSPKTPAEDNTNPIDLADHGLVLYLSKALELPVEHILTSKTAIKSFTDKIIWSDETAQHTSSSLVYHWDHVRGFQAYVQAQVPILVTTQKRNGGKIKPDQIVKFLRNFAPKEAGKMLGFPAWREKNPTLCRDINAPAPVVEEAVELDESWLGR